MFRFNHVMRGMIAASALALAAPAFAGDEERALAAIAEAQGKIDAAKRVDASRVNPTAIVDAEASVKLAQQRLKDGKEQDAIKAAIQAQALADGALAQSHQHNTATVAAEQNAAAEAANRAAAAEQAAANAAAAAAAARATPPVVVAQPATTTVTTETTKATAAPVRTAKKTTVKRRTTAKAATPRPAATETTTTTVTTTP